MPAVVGFWQLPEDERQLVDFIESTGNIVALPDRWFDTQEEMKPQALSAAIGERDLNSFDFAPAEMLLNSGIKARTFDGKLLFGLPSMESYTVNYRRGKLVGRRLLLSNLAAYWEYPSEDAARMIPKDDGFVSWAKKVLAFTRRLTPERVECNGFPYRATRRVRAAVEAGNLEPVLY